ncbi:WD40 repeat domain-containing protein [Nocardia arthritidis]|uniref:Uncharacterized protein n=1 Tax=Nocardia arthritidis TaxID=228602 RepID=A0A6G9Y9T8_9NOCA|nr:WD40 repeat domain-containing protein [Nocardia arthritidis]QIS09981.1 hypothetical protein F5544_10415 [Nocardia arthritidis]
MRERDCPIYDRAGPDDPALWLSMRYVDGGEVDALLAAHPGGLPTDRVLSLSFCPDGSLLASGSEERTVRGRELTAESGSRYRGSGDEAQLTRLDLGRSCVIRDLSCHRTPLSPAPVHSRA